MKNVWDFAKSMLFSEDKAHLQFIEHRINTCFFRGASNDLINPDMQAAEKGINKSYLVYAHFWISKPY